MVISVNQCSSVLTSVKYRRRYSVFLYFNSYQTTCYVFSMVFYSLLTLAMPASVQATSQ